MKRKEWVKSRDLIRLKDMPSTIQGINKKARRESWEKRKVKGVKGNIYEYLVSSMPAETQELLGYKLNEINVGALHTPSVYTNMVQVLQYNLTASAGTGSLIVDENPVASFSFSREWLAEQGLNNKHLSLIEVRGDSMYPTLHDHDLILISFVDCTEDTRDGVCVIRYDGEIFVKRLQYDYKAKTYLISSDNKSYKDFTLNAAEMESGQFQVIARVERVVQRLSVPVV